EWVHVQLHQQKGMISLSPPTICNSAPLKVLQSLMGHKSISSTEVYTKVFALDVAARHRVQFQMPEADAVAMLKGNI
ncbi:tyrosine-type recombinase/integrase, partial [Klebsiella pneumoniae]